MARTRRIKTDHDDYYLVTSCTTGNQSLFNSDTDKTKLVELLQRIAEFCGVKLKAYAIMSNHYQVIVKIIKPESPIDEKEILRRIEILRGEGERLKWRRRWAQLAENGQDELRKREHDRFRSHMHDISEFMKLYKEEVSRYIKKSKPYLGSIWSGRFVSTLIEGGEYLRHCMRHVIYNPIRARIVNQVRYYRWCWDDETENLFIPPHHHESGSDTVSEDLSLMCVVQISAGKIFGSLEFVLKTANLLRPLFNTNVYVHPVDNFGHTTHGWKLARMAA